MKKDKCGTRWQNCYQHLTLETSLEYFAYVLIVYQYILSALKWYLANTFRFINVTKGLFSLHR